MANDELTNIEKELILTCLLNTIADPEQDGIEHDAVILFRKLSKLWGMMEDADSVDAQVSKIIENGGGYVS